MKSIQIQSVILVVVLISAISQWGCSRGHYRLRADSDAYGRLVEKAHGKPWQIPSDFNVYPAPHSRLHDPTCVNDPRLPSPSPQLYAYDLPESPERDLDRFLPHSQSPTLDIETLANAAKPPAQAVEPSPAISQTPASNVQQEATEQANSEQLHHTAQGKSSGVPLVPVSYRNGEIVFDSPRLAQAEDQLPPPRPEPAPQQRLNEIPLNTADNVISETPDDQQQTDSAEEPDREEEDREEEVGTDQVPLPPSYWEAIPPECLSRMFVFESVRDEYAKTFGREPSKAQLDDSPELALEDIIDQTLLNSRELQTQKELLYRVSLALTLERFQYQLNPAFGNNGTAANYSHNRSGGETIDNLRIPTTLRLEKMMYSGADFFGQFANDVLLTFNGPDGFAVNVGSDLLFGFSQSILQRDVRLENLTQSERDVVYAARNFTRFRRELFVQQATDYYSLIRQFRQIEIQCQNYFTLAREFNQRSVEIKFGFAAKNQLDQVEQQVINGRQSILSACTNLENALDGLKIRMGVPTEQPLNINLSELNIISLRDELAVNAELIKRKRERIRDDMAAEERSPFLIVGGVAELIDQMLSSADLKKQLGEETIDADPLRDRLLDLRIEETDIEIAGAMQDLQTQLNADDETQNKVLFRRIDVIEKLAAKIDWQIRKLATEEKAQAAEIREDFVRMSERVAELEERQQDLGNTDLSGEDNEDDYEALTAAEEQLVKDTEQLQADAEQFVTSLEDMLGMSSSDVTESFESRAIRFANEVMSETTGSDSGSGGGLVPIDIEMDDAMMTGLVQRFDLMNQRGDLADSWRQIKYAGDDLRSILNLNATQTVRTRPGENKPFDLTFDESTTAVGLTLDLPFNRRAQRNRFRSALFDYQQTLRNVMQLEDSIKLSVRRDLRTLKLDRQQYTNDIAGAALASERVTGTQAEVRNGFATSRDFLESQQAYVQAISGVASDHINYIVGRLELFLDLEALSVGDDGFWDKLYDEKHQPIPYYQLPGYARPGYGELHPRLKYSKCIERMRCVPAGTAMVHEQLSTE